MTLKFIIMPSRRKRIGFLPSEEVHRIIDKLCTTNEISQSKVTGLLVEEALRNRGVLMDSFTEKRSSERDFEKLSFEQESFFNNKKLLDNSNDYIVNKKAFSDDIRMMHEFIEFKYFKKIMKQNNNLLE